MLDPHLLRNHLDQVEEQLARRSVTLDSSRFRDLDSQRKAVQVETQSLQNERNRRSKAIGKAKAMGEDIQPLLDEVQDLGDRLKEAETRLSEIQAELEAFMLDIPNLLDELFIFACQIPVYSQSQEKMSKKKHPDFFKLLVSLEARSANKKESILNSDMVKQLSELKPLLELNISSDRGDEAIQARFYFRNMGAFLKWYSSKETKSLLSKIDAIFKSHKIELNYTKAKN